MTAPAPQPTFYFDLGSPGCYLVAERIMSELGAIPEWEPVHGAALGWPEPAPDADALAMAIAHHGLQPLRLPRTWPPDTELAMLAATFAKQIGRAVAYSQAAFRQAFAGGRDLADEGTVLIAAAACEMHPTAVIKGVGTRSVKQGLARAGERALAAGATGLPAIAAGGRVHCGEGALEAAAAALAAEVAPAR
jgi:2-hydroxychromene-2-carboxylate isomerase